MENLFFFRCPKILAIYSLIIMCSNLGTPKTHRFPFGTNGKVVVLGVPILKHFRVDKVFYCAKYFFQCCLTDLIFQ